MRVSKYLPFVKKKEGTVAKMMDTVADAGFWFGASYGIGYGMHRFRSKAKVMGVPVDLAAGVGLPVMALAADLFGLGRFGWKYTVKNAAKELGRVSMASFGHTLGSGDGAEAAGLKPILVKQSDLPKIKATVPVDVLGAISPAPNGDVLSARDLADLAK